MNLKIEEYFVFQDKDILLSIFIELGKLFTSNQFINKSCFKCQENFKNVNF